MTERHFKQCKHADHKNCTWSSQLTIKIQDLKACCDAVEPKSLQEFLDKFPSGEIELKVDYKYGFTASLNGLEDEDDEQEELDFLFLLNNKDKIKRLFEDMYSENIRQPDDIPTEKIIALLLEYYINYHADNTDWIPEQSSVSVDREKIASALNIPQLTTLFTTKVSAIPVKPLNVKIFVDSDTPRDSDKAHILAAVTIADLRASIDMAAADKLKREIFIKLFLQEGYNHGTALLLEGYNHGPALISDAFLDRYFPDWELERYLCDGITPRDDYIFGYKPLFWDHIVNGLADLTYGYIYVKLYPKKLEFGKVITYRHFTQLNVRFADLADHYLPSLKSLFEKEELTRCIELKKMALIEDNYLKFYPSADLQALMAK